MREDGGFRGGRESECRQEQTHLGCARDPRVISFFGDEKTIFVRDRFCVFRRWILYKISYKGEGMRVNATALALPR
jgi:hypothetical protein